MRALRNLAFVGVSLVALSSPALAQNAGSAPSPDAANTASITNPADIVVEARRREERLQDVPKG